MSEATFDFESCVREYNNWQEELENSNNQRKRMFVALLSGIGSVLNPFGSVKPYNYHHPILFRTDLSEQQKGAVINGARWQKQYHQLDAILLDPSSTPELSVSQVEIGKKFALEMYAQYRSIYES